MATDPTDRLERAIEALASAQWHTTRTLDRLIVATVSIGEHVQANSDAIAENSGAIRTLTETLGSRLDALIARLDVRLDAIMARLDGLGTRLDALIEALLRRRDGGEA
jgi:hypothetical protein